MLDTKVDQATYFLAQLKPNSLKIAERNLARQGFQTFAPRTTVTKRSSSRFKTTEEPVFPGYIFVAFDIAEGRWRAVNGTTGVTKLVSFGSKPAQVPGDIMDQLFARYSAEPEPTSLSEVTTGDTVTVTRGPFADFIGQIERIEPNQRVWLLMDIMGNKTQVAVGRDQIRQR